MRTLPRSVPGYLIVSSASRALHTDRKRASSSNDLSISHTPTAVLVQLGVQHCAATARLLRDLLRWLK